MRIFTIGFTRKSAESFFETLRKADVKRVVDVRLHNTSQLAGYSKKGDLRYFLRVIGGIEYLHEPALAPTEAMLLSYRRRGSWPVYARSFKALLRARAVENALDRRIFEGACLLCAEERPDHCHRRLVAEYLADHWPDADVRHLV